MDIRVLLIEWLDTYSVLSGLLLLNFPIGFRWYQVSVCSELKSK